MGFMKCNRCKKRKFLTRHSKIGGHQPPFEWICSDCHDEEHGIVRKHLKQNKKVQRGTPYGKHKKK